MPKIEFNCPACNTPCQVDDTAAGMQSECPHCSAAITIPENPPEPRPPPTPGNLIQCPDCAQQVSKKAEACPRCGRKLNTTRTLRNAGAIVFLVSLIMLFGVPNFLIGIPICGMVTGFVLWLISVSSRIAVNLAAAAAALIAIVLYYVGTSEPDSTPSSQTASQPPPATAGEPAATEPAEPPRIGKWFISRKRSPIDDSRTVVAGVFSEEPITEISYSEETVFLGAEIREGYPSVMISAEEVLGYGDDPYTVITRFDKQPAEHKAWRLSEDGTAALHPFPTAFMKALVAHDTLVVRFDRLGESPATAIFDIREFDQILPEIIDARENPEAPHWE
jgi:hypothetical protein